MVSVYTQGAKISPDMAESILRIVTTKSEQFNVLDKLDLQEIINEVEHGFDELHAIDLIKQSPGFVSLIFIKKFPLTKDDMQQRFELSGVKPT